VALRLTKRLLGESASNTFDEQLAADYQAQLLLFDLPRTREALATLAAGMTRKQGR
jgi:hypothetical protein